jgi:hypothetical protein
MKTPQSGPTSCRYQGLGRIGKKKTELVMTTYLKGAVSTRRERKEEKRNFSGGGYYYQLAGFLFRTPPEGHVTPEGFESCFGLSGRQAVLPLVINKTGVT